MRLHKVLEMLLRLLVGCQNWSAWQPGNSSSPLIAIPPLAEPLHGIATTSHKHRKHRKYRSC